MDIAEDIRRLALQEQLLQFDAFDSRTAWDIGLALKAAAEAMNAPLVVDIQLHAMPLLSFALPGATPDNLDWARRKRNVVQRFHRSSYAIGRKLARENKSLADLGALPERDFATHGGGFPILLRGTGCVGAVTISGLPQREDHNLVVETIARALGRELGDSALG
jgi:uncharacterized protein (UPF0303 family)